MRWPWQRRPHHPDDTQQTIAELRAQQAALLHLLLTICAAADVDIESAAADAVPGVPPGLIAAIRTTNPRPGGEPVLLRSPTGREVIAVVGSHGNPRDWWAAIQAQGAMA